MFLYIILFVSLIFCLSFKTKRALHMLQQNLYNENNRYFKWLFKNKKVFLDLDLVILLISLVGVCVIYDLEFLSILCQLGVVGISIVLGLIWDKRIKHDQNKKPLVYTARIKRLVFTICVLYFIPILFMVLSLFVIIFVPSIEYGSLNETVTSIFLLSLCVIVYTGIYSYTPIKIFRYIILLIAIYHFISYVPTIPISFAITNDLSYLLAFLYGILCVILLIIFIIIMPKRTVYGNKMLAKINGFKNYLENITPQEIDKNLKNNPNYFYDILPYTFVLGISNVWIKKFENIKMSKPEWTSIKPFHFSSFSTFITHAIHTLEKNMRNN